MRVRSKDYCLKSFSESLGSRRLRYTQVGLRRNSDMKSDEARLLPAGKGHCRYERPAHACSVYLQSQPQRLQRGELWA